MSTFPATEALKVNGEQVYIHLPCLDAITWRESPTKTYGSIQEQGCDRCEGAPDGLWREVRVLL